MTQQRIPEQVVPGKRLGRHVAHDPRSLRYLVPAVPSKALVPTLWARRVPVFDQGDLGSCTGNAAAGVLGTEPYYSTLPVGITVDEALAVSLYSAATRLDSYPGAYPPSDTGSDGLSVAKATQARGYINGYLHATSVDAVAAALQNGPVITGVNWYDSFDHPDSSGRVTITAGASVRGGHEFELIGVDPQARTFRAVNSWGASWADHGCFTIGWDDYTRLLSEQGDATSFVPVTVSPPTPVDYVTKRFPADDWATVTAWVAKRHVGETRKVATILTNATS